ncbi:unnamed protein product [Rotaria socialis]|uniref:Reverse transcriptase domain-containing protein n=1 Tax=Rotaria socialis TaxID=392032 RepID=A0A820ENT2_9BILA|nr:unnamed protein product [Rotaria socialis]
MNRQLDEQQPREQAGFRSGFSTIDHLQVINQILERTRECKIPLCMAFVDYEKAFDSIEINAVINALVRQNIPKQYIRTLLNINTGCSASFRLFNNNIAIPINRGVRQGDTISPKLFTAALEDVFRTLSWENRGIMVDGELLTHLRFADDIVLFAYDVKTVAEMLKELNEASTRVGLKINRTKTQAMKNGQYASENIKLDDDTILFVNKYTYLGQTITQDHKVEDEIRRRRSAAWFSFKNIEEILKKTKNTTLRAHLFNSTILPVLNYGCEVWTMRESDKQKLQTTQRAIERRVLGIKLVQKIPNNIIRQRTKFKDAYIDALQRKFRWAGHVARREANRITRMGIDFVWFLPIHPIGITNRKGSLGSPYSINDFRAINPEYGTMGDFDHLVSELHRLGMRVMIDIVFRHTSHDCSWIKEYPEWYWRDTTGKPISRVPQWRDIVDLKFEGNETTLWSELIDILKFWCEHGVDGFRLDVASCVPIEFWRQARRSVTEVYPRCIWLAESCWFSAMKSQRDQDTIIHTDAELYEAFDLCYDYDLYVAWRGAVQGAASIKSYLELLRLQTFIYPKNFIKLRFVENHDQDRIAYICRDNRWKGLAWTAFSAFNKGCFLVHDGQEMEQKTISSLFEKDWVDNKGVRPLEEFILRLIQIKKHPVIETKEARLTLTHHSPCIVAVWEVKSTREGLIGIFNVAQEADGAQFIQIPNLSNGNYKNLFIDMGVNELLRYELRAVSVNSNGRLAVPKVAIVLHYTDILLLPKPFYSVTFDFNYRHA